MAEEQKLDKSPSKVVLISIDGWGLAPPGPGNAIAEAVTPCMDAWLPEDPEAEEAVFQRPGDGLYLHAHLEASGEHVGLPEGVMGNSEVGHLTMGAGRVSFQDLVRINKSIREGSLAGTPGLVQAFDHAKAGTGRLHLLGLVSDGGVHSHIDHLEQLLIAAKQAGVPECYVHFFADGRDTPPQSAMTYVERLCAFMDKLEYGSVATIVGRYYAMDRDKRWERIQIAFEGLFGGVGTKVDPELPVAEAIGAQIQASYEAGRNDEFVLPLIVREQGLVKAADALLFFDYRADRMRQIVSVVGGVQQPFQSEVQLPEGLLVCQMTRYDESFPARLPVLFPPQSMVNTLPEWLSKQGVAQMHTAETEKYAHVTFFFGGGREAAFDLEDRRLVASPKVATYDLQPEMSVAGVAETVVEAMASGKYGFVMCNFAPPDMVGHTGAYEPTVRACAATDIAIAKVKEACARYGYSLVVTSDHGNAEDMLDVDPATGESRPKTSHSTRPVPLNVFVPESLGLRARLLPLKQGGLRDVAPTVLALMGLPQPPEMDGRALVELQQAPKE